MFHTRNVEIGVGFFVALGLLALFMLAMKVSNLSEMRSEGGYEIAAYFDNIGGLKVRSPVTMAGVRIGRVKDIEFDDDTYRARVLLGIDERYRRIPADTSASIFTAGLLGEQYVALEPGFEEVYLEQGGRIEFTQSALVLEQLVGQFLFSKSPEPAGAAESADADTGIGPEVDSSPLPDPFAPDRQ